MILNEAGEKNKPVHFCKTENKNKLIANLN